MRSSVHYTTLRKGSKRHKKLSLFDIRAREIEVLAKDFADWRSMDRDEATVVFGRLLRNTEGYTEQKG